MSQSITTNFTSGQTLTAAQLNTAFGQAAAATSAQPGIVANAGKLLAGPATSGGQPVAITVGSGLSITGTTLSATGTTGGGGTTVRKVASGLTDTLLSTDGFVAWASSATGIKAETVGVGVANQTVTIKDAYGNAGTAGNAIVLSASGCTIDGQPSLTIALNFQSVNLQWDNVSNWMVF